MDSELIEAVQIKAFDLIKSLSKKIERECNIPSADIIKLWNTISNHKIELNTECTFKISNTRKCDRICKYGEDLCSLHENITIPTEEEETKVYYDSESDEEEVEYYDDNRRLEIVNCFAKNDKKLDFVCKRGKNKYGDEFVVFVDRNSGLVCVNEKDTNSFVLNYKHMKASGVWNTKFQKHSLLTKDAIKYAETLKIQTC